MSSSSPAYNINILRLSRHGSKPLLLNAFLACLVFRNICHSSTTKLHKWYLRFLSISFLLVLLLFLDATSYDIVYLIYLGSYFRQANMNACCQCLCSKMRDIYSCLFTKLMMQLLIEVWVIIRLQGCLKLKYVDIILT